jgi:DNA uptake protein ComE-like DNA-binding protein
MVLSILGLGLSGLVFQEIRFVSTYRRLVLSLPIAKAAVKIVFAQRLQDLTPGYDTFSELATAGKVDFCGGNSYEYYFVDPASGADGQVIDESGLINLNLANQEMLQRLPGLDEDLAKNIIDSGLRPFKSVNEVLLVEDIKPENFRLFKDMVTIYGSGKINVNTASKEVLLALGVDAEAVEAILAFRKEHKIDPPKDAPEDFQEEYGITSISTLITDINQSVSLGLRQEQNLISLSNWLDVKSEYLRFNVIPKFGAAKGVRYSITIHPATNKVLAWREY